MTERELQAWMDGEVGANAARVAAHVEACEACAAKIESWRDVGIQLNELVDVGVGEVEPLLAVQKIHQRLEQMERRSWRGRLAAWWRDVWMFNRRAVAGVAAAMALGMLAAPFVTNIDLHPNPPPSPALASVVVESLEFSGNHRAVVYRPKAGYDSASTTIIWVEAETDAEDTQ